MKTVTKKHGPKAFGHFLAMALGAAMILILLGVCFLKITSDTQPGAYQPTGQSTWGDVYRHFDADGFEALPAGIQAQLDALLLDEASTPPLTEIGETEVAFAHAYQYALDSDDGGTGAGEPVLANAQGYLYALEQTDQTVAGFTYLNLAAEASERMISCQAAGMATEQCLFSYVGVLLLDAQSGEVVAMHSALEETADPCCAEAAFADLESGRTYTLKAVYVLLPPDGCGSSGSLITELETTTA